MNHLRLDLQPTLDMLALVSFKLSSLRSDLFWASLFN